LLLYSIFLIEFVAYLTHKYFMHEILWKLGKDYYKNTKKASSKKRCFSYHLRNPRRYPNDSRSFKKLQFNILDRTWSSLIWLGLSSYSRNLHSQKI